MFLVLIGPNLTFIKVHKKIFVRKYILFLSTCQLENKQYIHKHDINMS